MNNDILLFVSFFIIILCFIIVLLMLINLNIKNKTANKSEVPKKSKAPKKAKVPKKSKKVKKPKVPKKSKKVNKTEAPKKIIMPISKKIDIKTVDIDKEEKNQDYKFMLDKYSGKFSYKIIEKNETTIGVSRKYASENSCIKAICNSKNLFNSEIVIKEENPNAHKKFGKPIIYIERCENEKHTFIIQNSSKTFFLGKYYDNKESCINDINNFKNYDLKYFIIDR